MDIEKLVAVMPRRTTAELVQQGPKLAGRQDLPGQRGIEALRGAIDRELAGRLGAPRDDWSKGVQGEPRYYREGSEIRAVVYRRVTHGADRGDYVVGVGGNEFPVRPRQVDDTRDLAESSVPAA